MEIPRCERERMFARVEPTGSPESDIELGLASFATRAGSGLAAVENDDRQCGRQCACEQSGQQF
jgi:hypothetical protein